MPKLGFTRLKEKWMNISQLLTAPIGNSSSEERSATNPL